MGIMCLSLLRFALKAEGGAYLTDYVRCSITVQLMVERKIMKKNGSEVGKSGTNFRIAFNLCYPEIKHTDWLK